MFQDRLVAQGATYGEHSLYMYYATLVDLFKVRVQTAWSPDWQLQDCLSNYGYNVGESVHNMWEGAHAPSEFAALSEFLMTRSELTEHIALPLQISEFQRLAAHFEGTRAWLRRAREAPSRASGRLPFFRSMR